MDEGPVPAMVGRGIHTTPSRVGGATRASARRWGTAHLLALFAVPIGVIQLWNFITLTSPLGHLPFRINPALGAMPDSIVFYFLVETFGILGAALLVNKLLRSIRAKRPDITRARQAMIILAIGFGIEAAWEPMS